MMQKPHQTNLLLDLHGCDPATLTEAHLEILMEGLADLLGTKRHGKPLICEKEGAKHRVSMMQFTENGSLCAEVVEAAKIAYVTISTQSTLDAETLTQFSKELFGSKTIHAQKIERK